MLIDHGGTANNFEFTHMTLVISREYVSNHNDGFLKN